jgi:hypothetical protein
MVRQCDPFWRGRGVQGVRQTLSHGAGHNGTIARRLPDREGVRGFRRRRPTAAAAALLLSPSARHLEVARHGRRHPGNLLALGSLLDPRPHRFEGHFNIAPGDGKFP